MMRYSAILASLLAMQSASIIGHNRMRLEDYHDFIARASRGKHRTRGAAGVAGGKLRKRFAREHKPRGY
ncbi:MAG: hypothetical protein KGL39_14670 [Patescibacteria group bacterium]|nr:hypothetical protein [Patescibacteria group bacterium]